MSTKKKVVVLISKGMDDERASVAWSIANGGIKTGVEVSIFLVSSGVDWVRKGAYNHAHLNPMDPTMKDMIQAVVENKFRIMVCPLVRQ
ncbi:MAG: DsrE family protein [Cyclobacteriaceae bacterium]